MCKYILLVIPFFLISLSLIGEIKYEGRQLSVDNGLSHTDVTSLMQDNEGFIWIGTYSGLNCFDGYKFTQFAYSGINPLNPHYNRIEQISLCKDTLWMATQGGITAFCLSSRSYCDFNLPGLNNEQYVANITSVSAYDNSLLAYIRDGQIFIYDLNLCRHKSVEISLKNTCQKIEFSQCLFANSGNLFITSDKGTFIVKTNENDRFFAEQIDSTKSSALLVDDRQLYIGCYNSIVRYGLFDMKQEKAYFSSNIGFVSSIGIDLYDNLWMGSSKGLFSLNNYKFHKNTKLVSQSIPSEDVLSILCERSGTIFAGTRIGGICVIDLHQKKFHVLQNDGDKNSLPGNIVTGIIEDETGGVWVGTRANGLAYHSIVNDTTVYYHCSKFPEANSIRCLCLVDDDKMLIGTTMGVFLFCCKRGSYSRIENRNLQKLEIHSISIDNFANIWASALTGELFRIALHDRCFVEQVNSSNKLPALNNFNVIGNIYSDRDKNELFLSTDNGLRRVLIDNHQIDSVFSYLAFADDANSFNSNFPWPLAKENDSVYWVGTIGGGLSQMTIDCSSELGYRSVNFTIENGAPSNDIESVVVDRKGSVWIAGKGISHFDKKKFCFHNFDKNDGISSNSFKVNSVCKGGSGRLYFGGIGGLTWFYPDSICFNPVKPRVNLTALLISGSPVMPDEKYYGKKVLLESIDKTSRLTLNHKMNHFTLHFSAMHYANPARCSYSYQLRGFDEDVRLLNDNNTSVTYTNLDYGTYLFEVNATNNDGLWGEKPRELIIQILPPWWLTVYAKILYVFVLIFIAFLFFMYQRKWYKIKHKFEIDNINERKREELQMMKLRFFTNISHEFRTPLTLISGPVDTIINSGYDINLIRKYIPVVKKNIKLLLSLLNEIMDLRKIDTGSIKLNTSSTDLSLLVNEVSELFMHEAEIRGIEFSCEIEDGINNIWIDRLLYQRVIFNLLSNAFKFCDNGRKVGISLTDSLPCPVVHYPNSYTEGCFMEIADSACFLIVEDNGIGISSNSIANIYERYYQVGSSGSEKHQGSGVGLALVKGIVLLHGGAIKVESGRNKGTRFIVAIPKGTEHLNEKSVSEVSALQEIVTVNNIDNYSQNKLFEDDKHDSVAFSRLLIIDDNPDLCEYLSDNLVSEYEVMVSNNGNEGFYKAVSFCPDVVICDVMMPEVDGYRLTMKLKKDIRTSHIPVIMLTAKSSDNNRLEGVMSGADCYLTKPFDMQLLKAHVVNFIKQAEVARQRFMKSPSMSEKPLNREEEFLNAILSIIEENLSDPSLNVGELSRKMSMSRSALLNKIKSLTGMSVVMLIRSQRLIASKYLIENTGLTIAEISYSCGFSTPSHFGKCFKDYFKKTPKSLR